MTTRAKQRKQAEELDHMRELLKTMQADNDSLLDLLNAILFAAGGRVVVSRAQLIAADRRKVHVEHHNEGVIITQEKREDGEMRPLTERLWLPGQPT